MSEEIAGVCERERRREGRGCAPATRRPPEAAERLALEGQSAEAISSKVEVYPMSKRILVIEDDAIGQKFVVDCLTAHGYEVSVARTGPEGMQRASQERPDLVLCDVLLPQKSGFEIKRSPTTRDVPVIFMSAVCKDSYSEYYASVDLRAQGYLVKPFSMSAMLERVRQVLAA
jgi:CheY-like chemotaxis protein